MSPSFRTFLESIGIGILLTAFTYAVGLYVGWLDPNAINWIEISAVFTSYSCTYMCVWQSRWNYPMGILTTFLYSLFYWTAEPEPAKAMALFNLYLVGSLTFGYFRWGPDGNPRRVGNLSWSWVPAYAIATAGVALLLWVATLYGAKISNLEAGIVIASALAQFLLDNKKIQTWAVWVVVNVMSIYFSWTQGWFLVMFQYVFFLMNTVWGWWAWQKSKTDFETEANNALIDLNIDAVVNTNVHAFDIVKSDPTKSGWLVGEVMKQNPLLDPGKVLLRVNHRAGIVL